MKVDLTDIKALENREVEKRVPVDLVTFDSKLGKFPITKKEDVALHIRNEEEVPTTFHIDINKEIPLEETPDVDEEKLEAKDYMLGFHLDLDRIIYDEVLVNWPMKVLCKEDCAGICKKCGKNLNHGTCDCEKTEPDPRMAVIQDVFKNFKEV